MKTASVLTRRSAPFNSFHKSAPQRGDERESLRQKIAGRRTQVRLGGSACGGETRHHATAPQCTTHQTKKMLLGCALEDIQHLQGFAFHRKVHEEHVEHECGEEHACGEDHGDGIGTEAEIAFSGLVHQREE